MGVEIERKFLVKKAEWHPIGSGEAFRQGYLSREGGPTVRVRSAKGRGYLTIKGAPQGLSRPEFEYEIPENDAGELLSLCHGAIVDKQRHLVVHQGHTWEVDVFHGDNDGLIVAEIELSHPDEPFERPPWAGLEVSLDPRYTNASLSLRPYRAWRDEAPSP
jgi:adenylate cyclase